MFAGKTTEMLKRVLWARNGQNREVVVLKPGFDNRYATTEIVSHDGLRTNAESINELPPPNVKLPGPGGLVVLDEVQFMNRDSDSFFGENVTLFVRDLLANGVDVVAAGLDMDYRGMPFEVTAKLAAMADEVLKIHANCTVCGKPARKTHKKISVADATGTVHVELGTHDKYEARCNVHWGK